MTLRPLLFSLIAGLSALAPAAERGKAGSFAATDWPHARGPRFDGRFVRETPLPAWPTAGPAQRWEQALGQGFSGLVVAGGRVYTQHQTSSGQELVCLDLHSGMPHWRTRYAYPWEMDGRYPGPYGTPTAAGDRVYFADCYGAIVCAQTKDGSIVWRFDAAKRLTTDGVDFGYAATPLVMDGRVYAPAPAGGGGATVFCLDAGTGSLIWQGGTSPPSYASCQPIRVGGRDFLLLPLRNGIAVFDRASGDEKWKEEWTRGYDEHSIWPVYQEPLLFCPSAFRRGARVYRLAWSNGSLQAESVWEDRILSNDVLASALHDGHLYGFDVQSQQAELYGRTRGTLKCVEFATGKICWTQTGLKHCSVTLVGERLLLLDDEGGLALVDPSPVEFRELARTTLPQKGKIWAAPVVIGDQLLVRGADSLACYALVPPADVPGRPTAFLTPRPKLTAPSQLTDRFRGWFERFRTDVFIAPSPRVLLEWYGWSLALLALSLVAAGLIPGMSARCDWPLTAALLGLAGTGVITAAVGRFTLTTPLALFALFSWSVPVCRDPRGVTPPGQRRFRAYLRLGVFVAACVGYYQLCGWLFLVSGWGFLTGFPVVVILAAAYPLARHDSQTARPAFAPVWALTAFTLYYGVSALAIRWFAT